MVGFSKKFFHFGSRANKSVGIHRSAILGKELYTSPASRPATKAPVGRGVEFSSKKIVNLRRQHPWSQALFPYPREANEREPAIEVEQTARPDKSIWHMHITFCNFPNLFSYSFYVHFNLENLKPKIFYASKNDCPCSLYAKKIGLIVISNSNCAEWSTIERVIPWVISKSDEWEAWGRFEIGSMIIPWIVRHEVQFLINCCIYNKFWN